MIIILNKYSVKVSTKSEFETGKNVKNVLISLGMTLLRNPRCIPYPSTIMRLACTTGYTMIMSRGIVTLGEHHPIISV